MSPPFGLDCRDADYRRDPERPRAIAQDEAQRLPRPVCAECEHRLVTAERVEPADGTAPKPYPPA